MNTELAAAQIEQYQRDGFLAINDFLSEDELQQWREVTDAAVAARLRDESGMTNQNSDEYYSQVFLQCINLKDSHEPMRGIILDERIGKVAATLAGVDGVRIWHDQALVKQPYGNATAWHLDNPFWSFFHKEAISIWVALDDATLENGCLWYLPGTHREARFEVTSIGANMRDLFKDYPEWQKIEAKAAPLKAGGAVFHNGLTAHGAGANMTNGQRRAMTCGYMPEGSTFNGQRNILSDEQMSKLKVGDVLNDDVHNPLIWRRSIS